MSAVTVLVLTAVLAISLGSGPGRHRVRRPWDSSGSGERQKPTAALDGWAPELRRAAVCLASAGYLGLLAMAPIAVLGLSLVAGGSALARRRQRDRAHTDAIVDRLAEVIDLYAVALFSGHNVSSATRQVAGWAPAEFGTWLRWCVDQSRHGRALSDALEELPQRLGAPVRPLVAALVANDRHGAPITTSLALLAADVRGERRRRAEAAARRLPVLLLFPLVTCVLPAFLLLTVVPVVIDTFVGFEL